MVDIFSITDDQYKHMLGGVFNIKKEHINRKEKKKLLNLAKDTNVLLANNKGHFGDDIKIRLKNKLEQRNNICRI